MSTELFDEKKELELAKEYCPVIFQQFEDIRDFLTPIILKGVKKSDIPEVLMDSITKPTLYFKVMEDSNWYYLAYMTFHPWDWSDRKLPFFLKGWIDKMDSHRYDTETILIRVAKNTGWGRRKGKKDICTVSHHFFKFMKDSSGAVMIESQGHGITPYEQTHLKEEDKMMMVYSPKNFTLIPYKELDWEALRKEFNPKVNMPDQQSDNILLKRFKWDWDSTGGRAEKGDIWNRPDILFRHAEIAKRL